jgi:hypothetical protein
MGKMTSTDNYYIYMLMVPSGRRTTDDFDDEDGDDYTKPEQGSDNIIQRNATDSSSEKPKQQSGTRKQSTATSKTATGKATPDKK